MKQKGKAFLFVVAYLTLTGCGGGSNTGAFDFDPISSQPSGKLTILSERDVSIYEGMNSFRTCDIDNVKLDPRLKVGTKASWSFDLFRKDIGAQSMSVAYRVKAINRKKKTFVMTMLALQGPNLTDMDQQCQYTKRGLLCGDSPSTTASTPGVENDLCEVKQFGPPEIVKVADGRFTFKDSAKTVNIKGLKLQSSGKLVCEGRDLGKGVQKLTFVTTSDLPNMLPSQRGFGCNSSPVYMYQQISEANGTSHLAIKIELLSQQ